MAGKRAPVFDEVDLDVSDFAPTPAQDGAQRDQVRAIAEPASFRSREVNEVPARREPRRHRTGRNVQLNLKVTQEDADAFYALADKHGWVLGEAFHMAIAALKQKESR
jgi:hypothetical protein